MASSRSFQKFDPLTTGLPVAEDAERYAIATSWQFELRCREYMAILQPDHFSAERNRTIWAVMRSMFDADEPITRETVLAEIVRLHKSLDVIGGVSYVFELSEPMVNVSAEMWAKPILETFARRRLMLKMNEAMIRLSDRAEPSAGICQEIEEEARTCAMISEPSMGFATFESVLREVGGLDAFLAGDRGEVTPYPWHELNRLTNGGMRPGQVIVVAGPSGRGKTALALNIAYGACRSGKPLVFSLEMQSDEIYKRILALSARVDSFHFKNLDPGERDRIRTARKRLAEEEILVDSEDCVSVSSIKSKVKKIMSVEPVSIVLIDYIQLIEGKRGGETREQEIAKIMRGLKRMAMQLRIPVVALSQILEDPGAATREPQLKDLRESRSIGHTADLVAMLHFTRFYDMAAGIPTGDIDLLIRKQRSGPEGVVPLRFHAPTGRFYEVDSVSTRGDE